MNNATLDKYRLVIHTLSVSSTKKQTPYCYWLFRTLSPLFYFVNGKRSKNVLEIILESISKFLFFKEFDCNSTKILNFNGITTHYMILATIFTHQYFCLYSSLVCSAFATYFIEEVLIKEICLPIPNIF